MKEQDAGTLLYITTSGPPFSGFWGSNCVIATSPGQQLHTFDIMMPLVRALVCWYVCIYIKLVLLLPVGSPLHHCS